MMILAVKNLRDFLSDETKTHRYRFIFKHKQLSTKHE